MAKIVLASGSPRRQELLRRMGITDFTVRVPEVEEYFPAGLTPEETVCYISREKSQAVASDADEIVITADTMVFLDDKKLGKPADEAEALQMLTALQGRRHTVCTGVTVRQGEKALTRAQHTDVYFRPATQRELKAYIAGGEPMDKAGAYGVQGQGALLVERIDGDFFNVMGLPVVLCVVSALSSGTGLLHNALGVIASPFRAAGSAVASWVGGISQRFEDVETLQQENDELRQQIAELEEQLRQMEPAATENKELRQLLGLRQQRSDLVFEAARVTQRDVSNWASTLVLDRGSQHGVAIGDCAVDSAGNLVGVVTDVGLNWCRLSTVLDTDSQFGARVFRTGETAVAGGDLALMAEGRLRLQYLSDSANLIKGDVIVTSGLGGYYPAGLVIGTVESVQTDDGGLARYAVLSPKCDVAAIQEMFIITDFDVIQ